MLTDGWSKTVASHATDYVSKPTWKRLFGARRKRCEPLAALAEAILSGKDQLHQIVGSFAGWFASVLGAGRVEHMFVRELASKMPLPYEANVVAVARGVQITGIVLCISAGDDLTRCQCFIDLALAETKTRVKDMLAAALEDWIGLAKFEPKDGVPA